MHIFTLAAVYAVSNQLAFAAYRQVDPGTYQLFKSSATLIVALIQWIGLGKRFSGDQWKAMSLQIVGMLIVSFRAQTGTFQYPAKAYLSMSCMAVLSGCTSVTNERMIKKYNIPLNTLNIVLYIAGLSFNVSAFFLLPNPHDMGRRFGFFEGFDNPWVCALCLINSIVGLVITAVLKYADAVLKCIASDVTAVLLCIISSYVFDLHTTLVTWCGIYVVLFAVHLFLDAPAPPPKHDGDRVSLGEIEDPEDGHDLIQIIGASEKHEKL